MSKTKEKPGVVVDELPTIYVPIQSIRVEEQHRRHFDEKRLNEMAGNIANVGVLQPLLVRPDKEDAALHLLVAGERRLRAAKLAGLETVPVRVGNWTDQEAAEIQAFENLHRQDLTPVEEARAFKTLKEAGNYDVEALAERVDKSEAYVYRAIALLELPEKFLHLIEAGELTPAHGHQVMRLPADKRKEAISWVTTDQKDMPTAKALKEHVDSDLGTDLKTALFPTNKVYANEVACSGCPFNSGNQGLLFDGATKGRCMKAACFAKKTDQAHKDLAQEGAKAFPALEYIGLGEQDAYYPRKCGITGVAALSEAEAKQKKIRQLVEDKPGKFAIAVLKPPYYNEKGLTWRWALVCREPALVGGIMPSRFKSSSSDGSAPRKTKGEEERENWIQDRAREILVKDVLGLTKKVNDVMLARVVLAVGEHNWAPDVTKHINEFFRIEGTPCHPTDLAHLKKDQLMLLAWACAIDWDDNAQLDEAGLDGDEIEKAAQKRATEDYAAKNKTTKDDTDVDAGEAEEKD